MTTLVALMLWALSPLPSQASDRTAGSPGNLTRDAFLQDWTALVAA
jgi:hypothetical protein